MTQSNGELWLRQHPECRSLSAAIIDQNGITRGKRYPIFALDKLLSGPTRLPLSVCNLDIWGRDVVGSPLVFASGDCDGFCEWTGRGPVPVTWLEEPAALVPLTMSDDDGQPFAGDPRRVLEGVTRRYAAAGLTPVVALELEFYLTVPTDGSPIPPCSPVTGQPLPAGSALPLSEVEHFDVFLNDIYRTCEMQDIPLEAAMSESGAGQFELNLLHLDNALKAADDAVLFKRLVRGVARRHGFAASFMARPYVDKAGNGMHVHCSMLDQNGRNIFADGTDAGSDALRSAVAGTLQGLAPCALLFAPHLNSYRRLQTESHAPTRVAWGYENRTAAVRIPGGDVDAKRFEHRVAGADANPYLVLAAILGACLHGMQHHLQAPRPLSGNIHDGDSATLPAGWQAALDTFSSHVFTRDILPCEFIELFSACKKQEIETFNALMSGFEVSTYLETV